jgi:hypothetical protein
MADSTTVPGSMASTGNAPADSAGHPTTMGRHARCERWTWECACGGVSGTTAPLGS